MTDEEILRRIERCLALGQSPNENEARQAMLMARRLMAKYKVSEAELRPKSEVIEIRTDHVFSSRRDPWLIYLARVIAKAYCCVIVSAKGYRKQNRTIIIVGHREDTQICSRAFDYAQDAIEYNAAAHGYITTKEHNSYAVGFVVGLSDAYDAQNVQFTTSGECTDLTVMSVPADVEDYLDRFTDAEATPVWNTGYSENAYRQGITDGTAHLTKRVGAAE